MPRVMRRSPVKRVRRAPVSTELGPDGLDVMELPLVNTDQKRQLILAHAAARGRVPQPLGFGMYVTAAVAFIAVVAGYALTIGTSIQAQAPADADPLLHAIKKSYTERFSSDRPEVVTPTPPLPAEDVSAEERRLREDALRGAAERLTSETRTSSTNPR